MEVIKYMSKNELVFDEEDVKFFREHVVFSLMNTEDNAELIETIPHRPFLDITVYYQCCIEDDEKPFTIITNRIMNLVGLNEQDMFELATKNTRKVCKCNVVNLEILPFVMAPLVLTNDFYEYGAATILDRDFIKAIYEEKNWDVLLLPVTIHEAIAFPFKEELIPDVINYLEQARKNHNMEGICLSDKIYKYVRSTNEIVILDESNVD